MKYTAIIPAREGSKGIPGKNLKILCGKPLIQWTIEIAIKSTFIDKIIVSTDSVLIAKIAKSLGAEVPFLRPKELSSDSSKIIDVISYYLNELPEIDNFILMQPTSPIRELSDIKNLVDLENKFKTNSVVTVVEHSKHPYLMYSIGEDMKLKAYLKVDKSSNRQSYPNVYLLNGSLYLSRRSFILENKSFINQNTIASIMPIERSIDIDNMKDWYKAESILKRGLFKY